MPCVTVITNCTLAKAGGRFLSLCHASAAGGGWTPDLVVTGKAAAGARG